MASFAPIPDVPREGLNLAESALFTAMKENIEILAGVRTSGIRAITSDVVTIQPTDNQSLKRVTAGASGYATSYPNGATLAAQTGAIVIISATDYANLIQDVQNVANDLAKVQNVVNSLIGQLRS
jgi:hypothetical protein